MIHTKIVHDYIFILAQLKTNKLPLIIAFKQNYTIFLSFTFKSIPSHTPDAWHLFLCQNSISHPEPKNLD